MTFSHDYVYPNKMKQKLDSSEWIHSGPVIPFQSFDSPKNKTTRMSKSWSAQLVAKVTENEDFFCVGDRMKSFTLCSQKILPLRNHMLILQSWLSFSSGFVIVLLWIQTNTKPLV